jgi:hypothetical protein
MAMCEPATRIEAYSFGSDWLTPDTERHWAWRCAHHLGLPFHSISIEGGYLDPPGGPWRLQWNVAEARLALVAGGMEEQDR